MSNFNFSDSIKKAAEEIKRNTCCAQHGKAPDYKLIKTTKGVNVQWSFCCDAQKQVVEKKFTDTATNQLGDDIADSLQDIFR